jgi:L-lactate dehydrogenase (cytochrome)
MGKLADPEGEVAIVKAAHACGVVYMLPTLSSCDVEEMIAARDARQPLFSQLYVNSDRAKTEAYVRRIRAGDANVKALFVTVDAPQLGRREKDMRNKFVSQSSSVQYRDQVQRNLGVTRAISSFIDPSLSWDDLPWLREIAGPELALILKGVQSVEDALLAFKSGKVDGIVLSNHGGRQLDASASGIELLAEVMPALRRERAYNPKTFHVYMDGGVRRGADVFKAMALGATAVGIGRPVLYALAGYGQAGIVRLMDNFRDELEMVMRLMGTPKLQDLTPSCVVTRDLSSHPSASPRDFLHEDTYEPLRTQVDKLSGNRRHGGGSRL